MTDRLLAAARTTCESRGYDVSAPEKPWLPPLLADPTPTTTPFVDATTSDRVAVEPLDAAACTPTLLLSRLRNNRGHDRFSLFVVDSSELAASVAEVLSRPPLVAAEDDYGRRRFYTGPDRIPLSGGGYAAVRTDSSPDDFEWREDGDGDHPALVLVDTTTGETLARLDSVGALACPDRTAFPYSYSRDPDDKRFRLRTRDGDTVGIYDGVTAMRRNVYHPVPMPLVPEHVFAGISSVRDEWAVLVAPDESASQSASSPAESSDVGARTTRLTLVTADTPLDASE